MNMPGQKETISPLKWVYVTAGGFILFLGAAVLFSIYSEKLNVISTPVYFFLLVMIAIVAAGFLFGALHSHAKYSGKAYNGTLELGGPVVVLAIIVFLGFKFKPEERSFVATVNVFSADSSHLPVTKGELDIYYGAAHMTKKISDGQVVLHELPRDFRGREVTIIPRAEGYLASAKKLFIPVNEDVINVFIDPVADSVTVSGIVVTGKGDAVRDAVIIFADGMAKTTSDNFGNFRIRLPFKDGAETTVRVYQDNNIRYNNLVRVSDQSPLSIQVQ
jgi:hypothetical protein